MPLTRSLVTATTGFSSRELAGQPIALTTVLVVYSVLWAKAGQPIALTSTSSWRFIALAAGGLVSAMGWPALVQRLRLACFSSKRFSSVLWVGLL